MFVEAQIISIFVLSILILNIINNKILKFLLSLLFSLFLVLQIVSYYITSELIDYRFFIHADASLIKNYYFQFKKEIIIIIVIFFLINLFFFKIKFKKILNFKKSYFLFIILFFLIILLPNKGVLKKLYEVNKIYNQSNIYSKKINKENNQTGFENFIENNQLSKLSLKESLISKKKLNIIYLILESVDYGLISGLPELTPNLNKLTRKWNFRKVKEIDGCNWTVGSIYCLMTGIPAYFPFEKNKIYQGIDSIKLVSVGDILQKSKYDFQEFYIGEADFTGTKDLLEKMNFNVFDYNKSTGNYEVFPNSFGYHDKDLFYELKKRISKLNRSNNSFAIFGATINTHLNGIKDDRMDDLIGSKYGNDLEHSIKSLDYLIGNFIEFLEKENLIENTAIFISADHSLPINKSLNYINNKLKNTDRSLYLISNKDINSEDEILQVHLPKILLNSANIKHNHKFFYELNNYNDLDGFIEKNKNNFSKYNNSIIEFKKTPKNIKFEINKDNFEIIIDNIPGYNLTLLDNSPSYINLLFDRNFIFKNDNFKKESKKPRKIRKEDENYNYNILTIFKNNNKIISGKIIDANKKIIFPLPVKNGEIVLNIEEYNSNFKLNNFMKDRKRFIAHAGGSLSGYKYLNALEALDENYLNGFRFFELDLQLTSDNFIVAAHDWDMWKKMTGFKKKTPPSLRDFNELRIYNKFTGLDYEKINKWFNENNNAVLVVDKINNVEKFSEQIKINKDRIIIETFSKESTTQFKKKGYKIIANIDFLRKLSNPIEFLKKNNIENISVSQKIKKNVQYNFINFLESLYKINLEKRLLNNGFKLYAFNLNEEDDTITEKDIVCKYRYIFYGMYADNWDFNKSINSCDNNDN